MVLPKRHDPDFHRPHSQITIDSPDFHTRWSQKCLLKRNWGWLMVIPWCVTLSGCRGRLILTIFSMGICYHIGLLRRDGNAWSNCLAMRVQTDKQTNTCTGQIILPLPLTWEVVNHKHSLRMALKIVTFVICCTDYFLTSMTSAIHCTDRREY